jgi:hypothetical protein
MGAGFCKFAGMQQKHDLGGFQAYCEGMPWEHDLADL